MTNNGTSTQGAEPLRTIVFFHPDLGIGGAERLIVDAAVGLQRRGHKVAIFTSHCDPNHCFEEAKDGTLDVRVRGNSIFPSSFLGRFHILLATLRQIHLVLQITFFWSNELGRLRPSTFVVDQLSACLPLLRWRRPNQRILFYCHFPDQLLARRNQGGFLGMVKRFYRFGFDWFEVWTMSAADSVIVNSNFTKSVVIETLGKDIGSNARVIYPCVDIDQELRALEPEKLWKETKIFLSINRFEDKKNIELAIRAFYGLKDTERKNCRLVIAGGYDPRNPENLRYHKELVTLAESLGLSTATAKTMPTALAIPSDISVIFLLSIPTSFKTALLKSASLLLYTPQNEHFGIVPVEAMAAGVPVLAANTGGPLETVIDGRTGWLRSIHDIDAWTDILRQVLSKMTPNELTSMGQAGKKRVKELFSLTVMAKRFEEELQAMLDVEERKPFLEYQDLSLAVGVAGIFIAALIGVMFKGPPLTEEERKKLAEVYGKKTQPT